MIDKKRWINTLPKTNIKYDKEQIELNPEKWINTIPKKNNYSPVKNYSLMVTLFIFGLLFVSVVKNETRKLQKENIITIKGILPQKHFKLLGYLLIKN